MPVSKCIVPNSSAYSSLCILPDGIIGFYVEEVYAAASGYSTVFYNFSLDWLTDGDDTFDPLGVAENQFETESLKVYPVSASSFVMIETEGMQTANIFNALGQIVKVIQANGVSEIRLDVSGWASGVYSVEGVDDKGMRREGKFVK